MTTICLIGGKLQGFEVSYLARKAGMNVVLIDRNEKPLIRNVVDGFFCFDVIQEPERFIGISRNVDAIIPVNENLNTLNFIRNISCKLDCPVLFDFDAYHISMDKNRSKEYFVSIGVPTPDDRPSQPPYFVKPPCESSSIGTSIIYDDSGLEGIDPTMMIEEYLEGDVVSLEIIGDGKHFAVVKETKVHIDDTYDCHMITPIDHDPEFRQISHSLAANLNLKGIMDVEAIASDRGLKVLEIDARFPSQTPTAVYHSSGINLVEMLMQAFTEGVTEIEKAPEKGYCIFEHLLLKDGELVPVGEHVLSMGDSYDLFHEENGLEIFRSDGKDTVFTLISRGIDENAAQIARNRAIAYIGQHYGF
ncbi:pyrrolysine biosynthesis protein PylC [Methanococcoides vulcani]|uniref:Pyrrolysine biosynthesis protein PylC n=1 Tax=Methanococcoides vulcani TaxID=1353158 RepID=A0A1H9Z9J2_9EURY|nr:3-methylornithine--L-lysine ligase PylC [Methanococcoides vulcani]SES78149.1 pyrrolysine biosynthesis protein PylC [Methanococcoides vulcani]